MVPKTYADRFGFYHHSPSSVQKTLEIDIFQKALKRRGETLLPRSPVAVGRGVEDYVWAMLIDGQSEGEAARHAMAALDAHELVPWDSESDQQRLDIHRDIIDTMGENARQGLAEALSGANQINGQERMDKQYPGLAPSFMGYLDFFGGGRVAELKTKTSAVSDSAKTGRRAGALPFKPDAKHARQVAIYADVMGYKASLIYASENGYRVFDETNCQELTPGSIQNGAGELRIRAWSREKLMRLTPSSITLI